MTQSEKYDRLIESLALKFKKSRYEPVELTTDEFHTLLDMCGHNKRMEELLEELGEEEPRGPWDW